MKWQRVYILALLSLIIPEIAYSAKSILFIGNSFTFAYGGSASVPDIFYALCLAGGHTNVTVAMQAVGGTDYRYHSTNEADQAAIVSRSWTHVILQDYSTEPTHYVDRVHSLDHFMTYGEDLYNQIMAVNGPHLVILYETWSRSAANPMITGVTSSTTFSSTEQFQSELRTNYYALMDALNLSYPANPLVSVAPVGDAWQMAGGLLTSNAPGFVDLYYTDEYHGNDNGYYLSASVFYARIFGQSPVGLHTHSAVLDLNLNLTVSPAFLESNAWATVLAQPQVPIALVTQPASQTVVESNSVMFDVLAEGSPPYYAQWYMNGNPIPGATGLSYKITSVNPDQNGAKVSVMVSNNISSVFSHAALLTVVTSNATPVINNAVVKLNADSPSGALVYDVNDARTGTDSDLSGRSLTYGIMDGNTDDAFAINSASGIITVNNPSALETLSPSSIFLLVSANNDLATNTAIITVNLINSTTSPGQPLVFLIDFGDDNKLTTYGSWPNDPSNHWNNVTTSMGTDPNGQLSGLVTSSGEATTVGIKMISRFNGRNLDGTTNSAVYPPNATMDSLFGNTEEFQGLSDVLPSFQITGLNPAQEYDLNFYASRLGATDNRETSYTAIGSTTGFTILNPANNVNTSSTIRALQPTADGIITVNIAPGTNNDNASHFTYLGALRITADIETNTPQITVNNLSQIYDGTAKAVSVATVPANLPVTLTYNSQTAAPTNVGVYQVVATVANPSFTASVTDSLTILPKTLTITADDKTKTFGAPDPDFTASFAGFANGETMAALQGSLVLNRQPGEQIGIYEIFPSGLDAINYNISYEPGLLTITSLPDPLRLSIESDNPTNILLHWNTVSNVHYRVRYRSTLNGNAWTNLTLDIIATGTNATFIDHPTEDAQRYYQVIVPLLSP